MKTTGKIIWENEKFRDKNQFEFIFFPLERRLNWSCFETPQFINTERNRFPGFLPLFFWRHIVFCLYKSSVSLWMKQFSFFLFWFCQIFYLINTYRRSNQIKSNRKSWHKANIEEPDVDSGLQPDPKHKPGTHFASAWLLGFICSVLCGIKQI